MEFEVYSVGICYASVCTSLTAEEAAKRLNVERPTGIESNWELSAENFASGQSNPCDCKDHAGNRHYLFSC